VNILRFQAMGTACQVRIEALPPHQATEASAAVVQEMRRLEAKYSRYRDDSALSKINAGAGGGLIEVDEETAALLDYADRAFQESGGCFDITSGVLRRAWDFRAGCMPQPGQVEALLRLVGWQQVCWDKPNLRLPAGMELDLGGVVKEYAADSAVRVLRAASVTHALVDLGGDVAVTGPRADGSGWRIGIQHPRRAQPVASVRLMSGAMATSGDYERYFEHAGRRYFHILDPRTGYPQTQGFSGVSVLAPLCVISGTAATVALLQPRAPALAWLRGLGLPFLAVTADGEVQEA
jgi:FAD:protein FMN transferase